MHRQLSMTRRAVLGHSAALAAAVTLGACTSDTSDSPKRRANDAAGNGRVGSATTPLPVPKKLREAPSLAEQVRAGELPPLKERLPEKPYVVPHNWLEPGMYGGGLTMCTAATSDASNKEFMYGHSMLRWLNDGRDIGPGLVERWESNPDASEWTFHFRRRLRWSDGEPWTVADILFWWEDMVLDEAHSEVPPDPMRSGKGTLAELEATDDYTLVVRFDAPAPLTADKLADWVNRGNGPHLMEPKHYLSRYHPRYNPSAKADWAVADGEFERNRDWTVNPDCPTMTGWRVRAHNEGRDVVWERNPYYWCVDRTGAQLPYLDTVTVRVVTDPAVRKLQIAEGQIDYAHGPFVGLSLSDVSDLNQAKDRTGLVIHLWDSGSGTGSLFLFNYDYREAPVRKLIRDPAFRQALSYAFDRAEARRSVYFDSGELTTGTMSPKALEYSVDDEARKVFEEWRDSHVDFNPDRAKRMLDDLGVVDRDGDGLRELPDGGRLKLTLDFPADAAEEHVGKNQLLARDWKAIGVDTQLNPVPPTSLEDQWAAGRLMSKTAWEFAGNPNLLSFPGALVPTEVAWWAPLHGQYFMLRGTPEADAEQDVDPYERTPPRVEPEPDGPIARMWEIYERAKLEPDEVQRRRAVWEITKVHMDEGPFFIGSVANSPQVVVTRTGLRNVPHREQLRRHGWVNPWTHPTPAVYDPETYFWDNPEEHT